jgi:two-component system sensor histidine kinase/response regulator
MQETLRILIIDDDKVDRMAVCRALKTIEANCEVSEAEDYQSAIASLEQYSFDCIFVDYRLPDKDGLAIVKELRNNGLKTPLIVLTGQGDEQIAVEVMKAGASDYLSKFNISPGRLVKTLQNAIRIYKAEQEAAIANQQKIVLARQKDDFVSRMTHDLRTPLVAANRMLELLQKGIYGETSPQMEEVIHVITRSNQNLLEMVNNLLEVYCHEAGEKRLNWIKVDLQEITERVVRELSPLAEEKAISLILENSKPSSLDPKVCTTVNGDRLELQRVLTNLVGNAIKFTDEGGVIVRLKNPDPSSSVVMVEIEDTGLGISPADQTMLFERFYQGNHRRSTSGLGLYLSRRIVEAHQGKVEVESMVNIGSIFRVYLPTLTA